MATRDKDLKSVYKVVTSETSALNIGGRVPLGMKRWVTFLSVDSITSARCSTFRAYFASVGVSNPTKASLIATTHRKYNFGTTATQVSRVDHMLPVMAPMGGPSNENPLFSIAAGKWLGVWASVTTVGVFMQYFDE